MKHLHLTSIKLVPLSVLEKWQINGGFMLWSPNIFYDSVVGAAVSFWDGFTEGFDDGVRSGSRLR